MSEENRTHSKRQKVDSTSDLTSVIDVETLSEKETDEDKNSEEQKTDEDEIQENGENNFFEESNPENEIEVELILVENNVIEEEIHVVEQPAAEERKTIQAALIQNAHSFKRRIIRKVKKRIGLLEGAIEQNTNAPLLIDTTKHMETLQIELPIKDIQEFISFDNIASKNPEQIEALALIDKEIQEGFSASGKGKNNLPFKNTLTYKTMRDVLLDYFHNSSESDILSQLSTWLARARDREGGRKHRM